MRIRLVTSLREFDALAPIWTELTRHSGQTSPFVSHDWFACCWRTAGPNRRRELWVVEDTAGPVAFLPFMLSRRSRRGLPLRMLQFLESPDTPFIDIPAAHAVEVILEVVLAALRDRRDWDLVSLSKLPAHSSTVKTLESALSSRFLWRRAGEIESPYLAVQGTWEEFLRGRSQRFRKTCRNIENRVHRLGAVTVEEHHHVDPDGRIFAEIMEVSRASWKGPRGVAMATMEGMSRFFRELTRRASVNGWLDLWVMRIEGQAVATEYQIGENGLRFALRADFDSSLAEVSPGSYLNQHIIQALFKRQNVHEYDMGPGTNEYKLRWASGVHQRVMLEIYAPTMYGRILHAIETRLMPLAQGCKAQLSGRCV